jgi:tetratricopeptide (TPR) repeat protein
LAVDSAFLAITSSGEGLAAAMLRLHLVLASALCVLLPLFVSIHFRSHRAHGNHRARRIGLIVAILSVGACVAGLVAWFSPVNTSSSVWVSVHEWAFVAAIALYFAHRLVALSTPLLRGEGLSVVAFLLLLIGLWLAQDAQPSKRADGSARAPAFEGGLSLASSADGHQLSEADLGNSQYCAQCHLAISKRWESSAHRFSSLNDPFYAASLASAQSRRSPEQLKFCGGCHDPLLLFGGGMDEHPQAEHPLADAGISCLSCHAVREMPSLVGNGSYQLARPEHYEGHDSDNLTRREVSNRLLRSQPGKHIASFSPPFLRDSRMCVSCHKAHIPAGLNQHRWIRGQNDWDPWHDSGAGGHSARTFYPPSEEQERCQDCHMPRIEADDPAAHDGKVADHAFPGANTALPAFLGDEAWLARNQAFLEGVISLRVGAVEFGDHEDHATGPRSLAPPPSITVPAGETINVDLVVRNHRSGHLFPGGIADLRELWLELELQDERGMTLAVSGWLNAEGHLDPAAHRWNTTLLDGEGEPLRIHDVEKTHLILSSRRIMMGASDVVRVRLVAPQGASRLRARILHRKFTRDYVEFVLGPHADAMPITELASTEFHFADGEFATAEPASDAGGLLRDLGIAYLLRGDTTLAREAALAAAARLEHDPGPRLDLARIALADGSLDLAEEWIRKADSIAPGHPSAAWLLARVRTAQGRHEEALAALDRALQVFPADRELWLMKGEALYRLERPEDSLEALGRVLQIDPEHLGAHALLAQLHGDRGDEEARARHQKAADRYRPRSEDRVLARQARSKHPDLDQRATPHYRLGLQPAATGWRSALPRVGD